MSTQQILSQVLNSIGSILNMIGVNIKEKNKTLLFFIFGNLNVALALFLLDAKIGMLVQITFVIETVINYFFEKKYDKYPPWLIALYIVVPCIITMLSFETLWDLLPLGAAILFPLAVVTKDLKLRLITFFSVLVWIPYNFHFGQYAGTITCIIFSLSSLIAIIRLDILKNNNMN